jgi:hypothetical protein
MAKSLKKRIQRLEAQVERLTEKVQALAKTATKKISRRRTKVAGASAIRKVKPAVVKPAPLTGPSGSAPPSGAA